MNSDAAGVIIFLVIIVVWIGLFATLGSVIARTKGRSGVGWGVGLGFASLSPVIAIILLVVLCCLPNMKTQRAKEQRIERENRRLREQLRQEQIKGESFRQHTSARLDAHDGHLGVDTRHTLADAGSTPAQLEAFGPTQYNADGSASLESNNNSSDLSQLAGAGDQPPAPGSAHGFTPAAPQSTPQVQRPQRSWHYEQFGESHGPVDESRLVAMLQSGELDATTLVWTENLGDWQAADSVSDLRPHVRF